ncbi:glycine cleavage system aminomethyltransferase GcvT [bacterium]|nr:glycine cleavage system aminomethyltransferase GcvT [bacterium]
MAAKKTALYEVHQALGAKIVEFAGYLMPVQYKGIKDEHLCVRNSVGLFDVSHMGEFIIKGKQSQEYLQRLTLNDVTKLQEWQAQYTGMCYDHGGMVDDFIVYRFPDYYMVIVNASNIEKDFGWMQEHLTPEVELENVSDRYALFAVQGRNAETTLQKLTDLKLSTIKAFRLQSGKLDGLSVTFFRTGYTGEDGFEIGLDTEDSQQAWRAILESGSEFGIQPIGLAARDTLRMEMKYCLYGNDIDETTNPIEAGLGWVTKMDKGEFVGREPIKLAKENGVARKLVGFEVKDRAVPRKGYKLIKNGQEIGEVTSGTFSPSLEKGIGLGYLNIPFIEVGTSVAISIRGKEIPAEVVKTPFYQRPY